MARAATGDGVGVAGAGRERILAAASALFLERGFAEVSMQEIAEAAGVTKAAPYYHFKDKEELFVEVFLRMTGALRAGLVARLDEDAPFRVRLERVATYILETIRSDVGRLFADLAKHVSRERHQALREQFKSPLEVITPYFERAAAAGEFGRVAPADAAAIYVAMVFGQALIARRRTAFDDRPGTAVSPATIVDVLFAGI